MSIKIIKTEPAKSVVKEVICRNCGVTLEYTPQDTTTKYIKDYTGDGDTYRFLECPSCKQSITLGIV